VGFQETIQKKYSDKFLRQIKPNKNFAWHWLPSRGRSDGILSGVKMEKLNVISFQVGEFSTVANVLDKNR
jgi:hypothetical protein